MDPGLDLATQVKMKRFWYHWGPWLKNRADGPRDSRHIRYMLLHHLRTDLATPGLRRADFESVPWAVDRPGVPSLGSRRDRAS